MSSLKERKVAARQTTSSRDVEWVPSICNFCSTVCNVRVGVKTIDGKKTAVKIEGNPNSPLNRGKTCARGQAGLRQTYDAQRLTIPLIRVSGSKRGEWNFRPASWEEAYGYVMSKLEEHQVRPWEMSMVGGWTSCVFYMPLALSFVFSTGIPNIVASPMQQCVAAGHFGNDLVTGNFNFHDEVLADFENAKYILLSMTNSGVAAASTSRLVRFAEAKKRGAKVVVLDPRLSETAAKADEWLPIKPGTDGAFFLALIHIMLRKDLYDEEFLIKHTNMPFLALENQGMVVPLMESDEQGFPTSFRVLDRISGEVRQLPGYSNTNAVDKEGKNLVPALEVPPGFTLDGHKVKTIFQYMLEQTAKFTPAWAEQETGLPAATIERIALEFGQTRPALVDPGWHGARYENILNTRRLQAVLQALVGGFDTPGGWLMSGEYHEKLLAFLKAKQEGKEVPVLSLPGLQFPLTAAGKFFNPAEWSHGHPSFAMAKSMADKAEGKPGVIFPAFSDYGLEEAVEGKLMFNGEPYRIKALLMNAANPVRHFYPDTRWKNILTHPNMGLVVAIDIVPSDTAAYADVILPNQNYIERDEPFLYGAGPATDLALTTRFSAVEPQPQTKGTADILFEFAIGFGALDKFMETISAFSGYDLAEIKEEVGKATNGEQTFTQAIRSVSFKHHARNLGLTPDQLEKTLREKGVLVVEAKEKLMEHAAICRQLPVPTPSGRIEIYSLLLAGFVRQEGYRINWDPGLVYMPPALNQEKKPDEFFFTYGKTPTVSYASTNSNNPILMALSKAKEDEFMGLWIHPQRASLLNIMTGDTVTVENCLSGQKVQINAFVTEMIRPDTVFMSSSFGTENPLLKYSSGVGTALNRLVPYQVEPIVSAFKTQEFTVRVTK
ncbi:polysulfide reductase chain A precursor [Peptococcaceae bacterium CEB3]|nr:polysulfide reductase chain A precursor [Peptococcaceae bacterium CEB3]